MQPPAWAELEALAEQEQLKKAQEKHAATHIMNTTPSRHLSGFAGTYEHAGYGTVEVELKDGRLTVTLDKFVSRLEHFHFDVFQAAANDSGPPNLLAGTRVSFASGMDGKITSVMISLEPNIADIVFQRMGRIEHIEISRLCLELAWQTPVPFNRPPPRPSR